MFNNGIKSVSDLRKPEAHQRVAMLFGTEITKRIMDQFKSE
jgi:hypothetical protein